MGNLMSMLLRQGGGDALPSCACRCIKEGRGDLDAVAAADEEKDEVGVLILMPATAVLCGVALLHVDKGDDDENITCLPLLSYS